MKSRRNGDFLILRLEDGERLFSTLKGALSANDVTSGIILTGIGMLKDFEIGYYDREKYRKKQIKEPYELVAMHGSVATVGVEPSIHIHAALANSKHGIIGGHLFGGTVGIVNEISIAVLDNVKLTRSRDKRTGLKLLDFVD